MPITIELDSEADFLLDTNILIDYLIGHKNNRLNDHRKHNVQCAFEMIERLIDLELCTTNPNDFKYVQHEKLKVVVPYLYVSAEKD